MFDLVFKIFVEVYRYGALLWLFFGMPFMGSLIEIAIMEIKENVKIVNEIHERYRYTRNRIVSHCFLYVF